MPSEEEVDPDHPDRSTYKNKFALGNSVRKGVDAYEHGALTIHDETEEHHIRAIGGRLGGHVDSVRSYVYEKDDEEKAATESTSFMLKISLESPPLVAWIMPALACALAYALYNIFIKKGSASIHPILGGVILQFVAAILGAALLGTLLVSGEVSPGTIHYDRYGIFWSVCAGFAVGTAEMLSFFVSSLGVQAATSIPIIIGGSVMFGALLGILLLGEKLMLQGWSGVILLVLGIALVASDPGDKIEEGSSENPEQGAPPFITWIFPALASAGAYAFYNILIKKGSTSINPILGGVVLQFVAALYGSVLLASLILKEGGTQFLSASPDGLLWACWAGIAVGTAELLSFCVSGMGVDATKSIPIIIGGSVMFGSVLGLLMLGESLMLQGWGGVIILMSGVGFVATDLGEKIQGH
jgi:transporter family protein